MRVLVTGAAGFIGFHLCRRLLAAGHEVVGFDNLNDYYSVQLKKSRLALIQDNPDFTFLHGDLASCADVADAFTEPFTHVVNLAAQAGVRYSLQNPSSYIQSNLVGFGNLLEACRKHPPKHLVFASSSSVYGLNTRLPFSTRDIVEHPVSLYAATKKADELMAHVYSHLFGLPCTGLRLFTVYGPWGRPDMAPALFADAILHNRPIRVFNNGNMRRDFTYIDDIIEGFIRLLDTPAVPNPDWDSANPDPATSPAPWRIYNIGNNHAVELNRFIELLENALGRKAVREYLPMQPGDVEATRADIGDFTSAIGFTPSTPLEEGIPRYVEWYRSYYGI